MSHNKIWRLSHDQFSKLATRFQGNIRGGEELRKDPLESQEEWKARIREHFNPTTLPSAINYVCEFGIVTFVRKSKNESR